MGMSTDLVLYDYAFVFQSKIMKRERILHICEIVLGIIGIDPNPHLRVCRSSFSRFSVKKLMTNLAKLAQHTQLQGASSD
jgi:hypothetical protein